MLLLTLENQGILHQLIQEGRKMQSDDFDDHNLNIIVKIFTPDAHSRWLLSYVEPSNTNMAWGIADLGHDCVEWGLVPLEFLDQIKGPLGSPVQIDWFFEPIMSAMDYLDVCLKERRIIF